MAQTVRVSMRLGAAWRPLACAAVTLAVAAPAIAQPPIAAKRAEAQRVFAETQRLGESLSREDELVNLANLRLAGVERQRRENTFELGVAQRNLRLGQAQIARTLVNLYTTPQQSFLEVLFGAKSVDEMLAGLDNAHRVSSLDASVLAQVRTFRADVEQRRRELSRERADVARLLAERRAARAAIVGQLAERRRLLASIHSDIARLEAEARAHELAVARAAAARIAAAATAQRFALRQTVVGATVQAPSGLTAAPPSSYGGRALSIAMSFIGTPYVWGGGAPGGFDCSGLVMYAYAQLGISLPHSSYAMWSYGVPVAESDLQPGDIVFFDGLGHVGLYAGGGTFLDAPYTGAYVRIDSLLDSWAQSHYVGARRIL